MSLKREDVSRFLSGYSVQRILLGDEANLPTKRLSAE